MLTIKMGIAIHADYSFEVISDNPMRKAGPYTFVNNELTKAGLAQYAKDIVIDNALFGTSNVPAEDFSGVQVPVKKFSIAREIPTNELANNATDRTFTISSKISFLVENFGLSDSNVLALREFGIENFNRLILVDPFQDLDGLNIGAGDRVKVTITFHYTYYTNNKIGSLGDDAFGERVDYVSEVLKIRDKSLNSVRQNPGYASPNPIDIFPIVRDIRGVPANMIDIPIRDEFQQEFNNLDPKVQRMDVNIIGYYANRTMVYGFVLRDNLRGMATLVRFLTPVLFEAERRYEVGGYIQWARTIDDMDDGFSTIDLEPVSESIQLDTGVSGAVAVVQPLTDVAVEIGDIKGLKLIVDGLGIAVDLENVTSWGVALERLMAVGIFEQVELLSNRVGARKSSLYQYVPPNGKIHKAAVDNLKASITGKQTIFPSLIAGGDYSNTSNTNRWRWDCHFPYFGPLENVVYVPYGFASYADSKPTIDGLPAPIKLNETLTTYTLTGEGIDHTADLTGKALTDRTVMVETIPGIVAHTLQPVTDITPKQVVAKMVSDFDTPNYDDWVKGTTEVTVNMRMLDLRSDVVSDNRRNVTSFNIIIDPARHHVENSQVWINGRNYDSLDSILPATLALIGVGLKVTPMGARTKYTFTRPYAVGISESIDIFIVGDEFIYSNGAEVGYLTLETGNQGFRVYNPAGSEVTGALYPVENPFLMAGVKLFQPLPDYIFKSRILTLQEARTYFNDPSIVATLPTELFTTSVVDNVLTVSFTGKMDWRSEHLNSNSLYPAIGIDLSRIGENIPETDVVMQDASGKNWTKAELLNTRTTHPNRVIGDVFYFATPVKLVEGNQQFTDSLESEYYTQSIGLLVNTIVTLEYPLEAATISPNPTNLMVGNTSQATYTYTPPNATITHVEWSTLDETIATVSEMGLVTAVRPGSTTLRLLLNQRVIATAAIVVTEKDITISCDGADNFTTCLNITGTELGVDINDVNILTSNTQVGVYQYFRDSADFRIVNCNKFTEPAVSQAAETNFLELDGEWDVYVGGCLISKAVAGASVADVLAESGQLIIMKELG